MGNSPISCRLGWNRPTWQDLGAGCKKSFGILSVSRGERIKKGKKEGGKAISPLGKVVFKENNREKKRGKRERGWGNIP